MPETIIPSQRKDARGRPLSYQMPEGLGHYFATPNNARWGRLPLILFLTRLSARWALLEPGRPFGLGDLGYEDLRPVPSHKSHGGGLSADLYVIHAQGLRRSGGGATKPVNLAAYGHPSYDAARTLRLAREVARVRSEGYAFTRWYFNDPTVQQAFPSIRTDTQDRRSRQHDDHMHLQLQDRHPYAPQHVETLLRLQNTL